MRKQNIQGPTTFQGAQNMNTEQQKSVQTSEKRPVEKEKFTQSPTNAKEDGAFDGEGPTEATNQIQSMTREAGDGQQQNDGAQQVEGAVE